jgi:hypothetical protein
MNVAGAILDTMAFGVSTVGFWVEFQVWLVGVCADGPVPVSDITAAPAAALVAYQPFNLAENDMAVIGMVNTALADIIGGYTYFDADTQAGTPELVIGQDTMVAIDAAAIGSFLPEASLDSVLNLSQMMYSWISLGSSPRFEARFNIALGWYAVDYGRTDPVVYQ